MNSQKLTELTDKELLRLEEVSRPKPIIDAFLIGALVGVLIYSVVKSTWGLVTLIPLLLLYIFLKKPKKYQAIQKELKERNLKQ